MQSMPLYRISLRSILILNSPPCLDLPGGFVRKYCRVAKVTLRLYRHVVRQHSPVKIASLFLKTKSTELESFLGAYYKLSYLFKKEQNLYHFKGTDGKPKLVVLLLVENFASM
jgi:hypothetical protein